MTRPIRLAATAAILLAAVSAGAWSVVVAPPAAAATTLTGTFTLTPGSCGSASVSGTYLRMILPSGGVTGPYMSNADSRCKDQSYTSLSAGTDGGLISGSYQATPNPPFDTTGNALAGRITAPAPFYGTSFATSSNPKDPQTGLAASAPRVIANGSSLTADLRAFSVTWNNQYFNQGAPKPDGSYPGNTRAATGTYNASTGAFTLSWTSQVVGGPFDKFTGQWHLAGRFVPAGSSAAAAGQGARAPGAGGAAVAGASGAPAATNTQGAAAPSTRARTADGSHVGVAGTAANSTVSPGSQHLAASTTTVSKDRWHISWWIVALAVLIALLGFATIAWLNRAVRSPAGQG